MCEREREKQRAKKKMKREIIKKSKAFEFEAFNKNQYKSLTGITLRIYTGPTVFFRLHKEAAEIRYKEIKT